MRYPHACPAPQPPRSLLRLFFFFNDTATTEIYTLSLHDALPICDYEYERCGTANVFCGIEPKAGVHFTKVTPTRASPEFADFILEIAAHYPAADTIHLVMDNLSTHTPKALVDRFGEVVGGWLWDRFTVHYTPKHGS